MAVDEAIAFSLRPMERVGHTAPPILDGFDLLQNHFLRSDQHTIDPALNSQGQLRRLNGERNRNFLLVTSGTRALEPLMAAGSSQRPCRPDEHAFAAKIAPPERELDHLAHRD